jgi:hypothetical protein
MTDIASGIGQDTYEFGDYSMFIGNPYIDISSDDEDEYDKTVEKTVDNADWIRHAVESTIERNKLDRTSFLRVALMTSEWRFVSTKRLPHVGDFSIRELIDTLVRSARASDAPIERIEKVLVKYSKPVQRGGSGTNFSFSGPGSKALIPIFDHGSNLCAATSFAVLAARYDMQFALGELRSIHFSEKADRKYAREVMGMKMPSDWGLDTREKFESCVPIVRTFVQLERKTQAEKPDSLTSQMRRNLAEKLHSDSGVEMGAMITFEGLSKMTKTLSARRGKQCLVMVFDTNMKVLYSDRSEEDRENHPIIDEWYFLLLHKKHYQALQHDGIHKLFKGTKNTYFCPECCQAFQKEHTCNSVCRICGDKTDHLGIILTDNKQLRWQRCNSCHRTFAGKECFERHKQTKACEKLWKCLECKSKFFYPPASNGVTQADHKCGKIFCHNCKTWCTKQKTRSCEKQRKVLILRF